MFCINKSRAYTTNAMWLLTIYAPMIYTAPCIMFWMRAYPLRGQVVGGWALEFESCWALWNGIVPRGEWHFGAKKKLENSRAQPPPTCPSNGYALCFWPVLLQNGCTMKRCLHRKVDFKTNALNNAHVSQLLHYKAGLLQNDGITLYFKIKTNSLQVGTNHRTLLVKVS
jgi:hypothetical protein